MRGSRRPPPCPGADAARQVALASELDSGHDATADALDAGLVSPEHAAVIVRATGQLPAGVSEEQRQMVETELVEKAGRFSPDQLRRFARRAIEAVEPDQKIVDAHENELIRTEEQAAREKCSLTPARQRRRHHHRPLHHPGPGRRDARQGHRRDDSAPTDARRKQQTGPSTGGTAAGSRSPSCSSTSPRTPALEECCHGCRHHRPHRSGRRAEGSPPRHRPGALRRRSPSARLHRRHPPRRPRHQVRRPRPRPGKPAVLRGPTSGQRTRTHHLRRHRLRTPLRLVRTAPPTTVGPRRPHRPADAIPLCSQHHHWIHDTGFNHQTMPDGSIRFSRRT